MTGNNGNAAPERDPTGGPGEQGQDVVAPPERSIRPGRAIPETVLVATMTDHSVVICGHPLSSGTEVALLTTEDARPLLRELAAAFDAPPLGASAPDCPPSAARGEDVVS